MDNTEDKGEEISLNGIRVCVAIPCYGGVVPVEQLVAFASLFEVLPEYGIKMDIVIERENALIACVRDKLVHRYLSQSSAEYLFFLDDDMIFTPEDFLNVLTLATKYNVVAGAYPARKEPATFFIRLPEGKENPEFDPKFGLIKACGTGLGFVCIKREIIEKFAEDCEAYNHKELKGLKNIFKVGVKDNRYFGEDIWFFEDLYNKYNQPVWIHPLVSPVHVGRKDYDYKLKDNIKPSETKFIDQEKE